MMLQWILLLASSVLCSTIHALQVHVITRHGARTPLTKNPHDLSESGGQLTATGYAQHVALGQWLRERYPQLASSSSHYWMSSPTQRTLVSAQGLASGFFGQQQQLPPPIYTTRPVNDVTIRAYDKCPVFQERLRRLYTRSTEWNELQASEQDLLRILVTTFPQYAVRGSIPLADLWNVFDQIDVAQATCRAAAEEESAPCQQQDIVDLLTPEQWDRLRILAHQAEVIKYATTGGNLLGSNLVMHILDAMITHDTSDSIFFTSGHYPTLLGVLATLQLEVPDDVIPPLASALLLRLDDQQQVTIEYKPGNSNTTTTLLVTSLSSLQDQLRANGIFATTSAWCKACENTTADVCLRATDKRGGGVAAVATTGGLLLLATLFLWRRGRRRGNKVSNNEEESRCPEAELT